MGKHFGCDFYTARSLPLFNTLVLDSVYSILGNQLCKRAHFVEVGYEAGQPMLNATESLAIHSARFSAFEGISYGNLDHLPSPAIVFSNELFDAQAFHRFQFHHGSWVECGLRLQENGSYMPCLLDKPSAAAESFLSSLPNSMPEGYILDYSIEASRLLKSIVSQDWTGLFIAFDYGKSWESLLRDYPAGTARAYTQHRSHERIWEQPGEQDITHHVCWDDLRSILESQGFQSPQLQTQAAFFMQHARGTIRAIVEQNDPQGSDLGALKELIHPAYMGERFQVLWALR